MQKWAVWVSIALGIMGLGLTIYIEAPTLEERLGVSANAISIVALSALRWSGLGLAISFGVAVLLFAAPKVWSFCLDLRDNGPARRRFQDLLPLVGECQEAISRYLVWWKDDPQAIVAREAFATADERLRLLHEELTKHGCQPPSLLVAPPDLERWNNYLARLAVSAQHGDLEGARRLPPQ